MMFMLPIGGVVDGKFGIMTQPGQWGVSLGIKEGMPWCADNECYSKQFDELRYRNWLGKMLPWRSTCLFVVCADVVGDASATLDAFEQYHSILDGWPVAFVAQDGQESLPFPDVSLWSTMFLGGTTKWKLGDGAVSCIKRAQELGKSIHIGRVNYLKRYSYFAGMSGSEEWTCDGTRTRYELSKCLDAWAEYQVRPRQLHLPLSHGDYSC